MDADLVLEEHENVLRRFNPSRPEHVVWDEGAGLHRLRRSAFYMRSDEIGLSVYRRLILELLGIAIDNIVSIPYVGLAEASTASIHRCSSVWQVRADPWPDGEEAAAPVEEAHGLVVPMSKVTRAAELALAACFLVLEE